MITIGKIRYNEVSGMPRIETTIKIDDKKDFLLFVETDKEYGEYLVTERADAFLVGILMKAMLEGHDIRCENPVSAELKFLLEKQLIVTLVKYDDKLYHTKIYCDTIDDPIMNSGAVGTGISLGLDSFNTIAETYHSNCKNLRLTHLMTFNNGVVGGFYKKNNWDYCASKLYEREKEVARELGLPLISVNTNLSKCMHPRVDYYITYRSRWLQSNKKESSCS